MVVAASLAFWLGLESGRRASRPASVELPPVSRPSPAARITAPPSAADPVASASGLTWAIYTSRDRLTDDPLLGARFGTAAGTPLFTVLCAEGQAALSLKRGLLPAVEGASGNSKSTLDTIRVGVRIGGRERDRVDLRFEDALPESFDVIPEAPLEFLRRVTESLRIRTATDDFDPSTWAEALARVTGECVFEERDALPPTRMRARR